MTTDVRKNICKVGEFLDNKNPSLHFKASCNCIGREHDQHICLEIEKDIPCTLITTFYYECVLSEYYVSLWKRIKTAIKVLLGSSVCVEGEFLFDEEGLSDYLQTLNEAKTKLIQLRENSGKKE